MTKGSGGGITHPRLVKLIQEAIAKKGQRTIELETGLSHSMLSRYKRGIGEPTTATLIKLADYFGVTVFELRGDLESQKFEVHQFISSIGDDNERLGEATPALLNMLEKMINTEMQQHPEKSKEEIVEQTVRFLVNIITSRGSKDFKGMAPR